MPQNRSKIVVLSALYMELERPELPKTGPKRVSILLLALHVAALVVS